MKLHIIHQGLSVLSVSNRLLNQEMSIEKGITFSCVKYWFLCIFRLKNVKIIESVQITTEREEDSATETSKRRN